MSGRWRLERSPSTSLHVPCASAGDLVCPWLSAATTPLPRGPSSPSDEDALPAAGPAAPEKTAREQGALPWGQERRPALASSSDPCRAWRLSTAFPARAGEPLHVSRRLLCPGTSTLRPGSPRPPDLGGLSCPSCSSGPSCHCKGPEPWLRCLTDKPASVSGGWCAKSPQTGSSFVISNDCAASVSIKLPEALGSPPGLHTGLGKEVS